MLNAIRLSSEAASAAPASTPVVSPYAPVEAPDVAGEVTDDQVVLSAPTQAETAEGAVEASKVGKKTALVAAGVAAAIIAGVVGPALGGALGGVHVTPPSQSITLSDTGTVVDGRLVLPTLNTVDGATVTTRLGGTVIDAELAQKLLKTDNPAELVAALSSVAEQASQMLPATNTVHADWQKEFASMADTANALSRHADALMRNSKKDAAAHHAAIEKGLDRLAAQLAALEGRMTQDQPAVDAYLAYNRDLLNQIGTISFNIERNIEQTARQMGYFSPQRQDLRDLGKQVHEATVDLAASTEKTTTARAIDKGLLEYTKAAREMVDSLRAANQASKTQSNALGQVDEGARVLDNVFRYLEKMGGEGQKAVDEAAARAHEGAVELTDVFYAVGGVTALETPAP